MMEMEMMNSNTAYDEYNCDIYRKLLSLPIIGTIIRTKILSDNMVATP